MIKITCPVCGAEYLPNEIYLPNSFMGDARDIVKDANGKILDVYGETMDLKEHYQCDYCNAHLQVSCKVNFSAEHSKKHNLENYKTELNKPSLFMKEE